jgi:hypothetical protein
MARLAIMLEGRGLVDKSYKDHSSSEHGRHEAYKLALYPHTFKPQTLTIVEEKRILSNC